MTTSSRLIRRLAAGGALTALALAVTACFGASKGGANDNPNADVTITFWHGWTAPERGRGHPGDDRRVREEVPQHPRQGRRQHHRRQDQPGAAGRRPQRPRRGVVVHHRQRRRVLHLRRLRRPHAVHEEVGDRPDHDLPGRAAASTPSSRATSARCRCSATPTASTTTRTTFAAAGITSPPKTFSEFDADAVKLTKTSGDTYSQLGFMPNYHGYESTITHFAAQCVADVLHRRREVERRQRPGPRRDVRVAEGAGRQARRLRQAREVPHDVR